MMKKFWNWYENHAKANTAIASFLFLWQLVHLIWLTVDVVFKRLFGVGLITLPSLYETLVVLVDYTEIPALIMVSLVYINELRKEGYKFKNVLYLFFLNSQFLHIFWITDEFVVNRFTSGYQVAMPVWLAWVAIGIDYLELPVMFDTAKRAVKMFFAKEKENA